MTEVGQELTLSKISGSTPELDRIARMGLWLAAAESDSKDPKARGMAAALRIAYAEALGLPAHAGSDIHLIRGNLSLSAKLCRALGYQHGVRVEKVKATETSCTVRVVDDRNGGRVLGETTYTLDMARKAGLSGDNWTRRPDRMLWARASKQALDDFAPWVTVGVLSHEQAVEITEAELVPFEEDDDE